MGNLYRETKDGLLSIAGMLIEDPTLNRARIDSAGNLYARMLVEDPALLKVQWGQNGIVQCREFWENSLWTPSPTPQKHLYISFGDRIVILNAEDLSRVTTIYPSILSAYKCYDFAADAEYIYGFASEIGGFIKIKKGDFTKTEVDLSYTDIGACTIDGEYLLAPAYDKGNNRILRCNKNGEVLETISAGFGRASKLIDIGSYYLLIGNRYTSGSPFSARLLTKNFNLFSYINYVSGWGSTLDQTFLYATVSINIDGYYQWHIVKIALTSLVEITRLRRDRYGIIYLQNALYVPNLASGKVYIEKYDTDLKLLDGFDTGVTCSNIQCRLTTDGTYIYIITRDAPAKVLKINPINKTTIYTTMQADENGANCTSITYIE